VFNNNGDGQDAYCVLDAYSSGSGSYVISWTLVVPRTEPETTGPPVDTTFPPFQDTCDSYVCDTHWNIHVENVNAKFAAMGAIIVSVVERIEMLQSDTNSLQEEIGSVNQRIESQSSRISELSGTQESHTDAMMCYSNAMNGRGSSDSGSDYGPSGSDYRHSGSDYYSPSGSDYYSTSGSDYYSHSGSDSGSSGSGYDHCAWGCPARWIGDDYCDTRCNVAECNFDGGDCGRQGSGSDYNSPSGSDYYNPSGSDYSRSECAMGCRPHWIGDRVCDTACNVPECNFDGGDCAGQEGSDYNGHYNGRRRTTKADLSKKLEQLRNKLKDLHL